MVPPTFLLSFFYFGGKFVIMRCSLSRTKYLVKTTGMLETLELRICEFFNIFVAALDVI